ncbi:MAG: class I SAM-dependent methyltransferase [Candidatus Helarchaeota archaeon]
MVKYGLRKVGIIIKPKDKGMSPQLDDIEAEITYLLIREFKPETVVEISPCGGYSTSWILNALNDNNHGKLYSFDIIDKVLTYLPKDLVKDNWTFVLGDVRDNLDKLPDKIDYLFMDSDHSHEFAVWYINNIFPKLKKDTLISVHDVYYRNYDPNAINEGTTILKWLDDKKIEYFTVSPFYNKDINNKIIKFRKSLKIKWKTKPSNYNSMIYFFYK